MSAFAANWPLVLLVPVVYFLHRGWKARNLRDRYRWHALQYLLLGVYSVIVFLELASLDSPASWFVALPMLAIALFAGAVTGVYVVRWLAAPPGPALCCPLCNEIVDDGEAAFHHVRLFHPQWYEEVTARGD